MRDYFIRRLLLIPPTLLGITVLAFCVTRLAPGGPLEQAVQSMRQMSEDGSSVGAGGTDQAIDEEQMEELRRLYGYDKPIFHAYLIWLGVLQREVGFKLIEFDDGAMTARTRVRIQRDSDSSEKQTIKLKRYVTGYVEISNPEKMTGKWHTQMRSPDPEKPNKPPAAELFQRKFSGVLQGNFGKSFRYGEPVVKVITERLSISSYFGLLTFIITYAVCIPLGIFKAVRHNTWMDNSSSVLIFIGYAVPGYALGSLLLLFFSVKMEWLPMGGLTSIDHGELSAWGKLADLTAHTFQPLCCYLIGSFAFVTMLMKNHLMDNLAADYVRTAMAKGVTFKDAVRKHALRNSLIPIATNVGHQITLFVAGSFLIETIFDIDGFGLLGFNSVMDRDIPVVMGVLLLSATLMLLGNILADLLVALVDPRVRFN
jgi:microcin C transport system permease protein